MCSVRQQVYFYVNQIHFHMKRFARDFVFKERHTRKWPIPLPADIRLFKHLFHVSCSIEWMMSSLTAQLQLDIRKTIGNSAFKLKRCVAG